MTQINRQKHLAASTFLGSATPEQEFADMVRQLPGAPKPQRKRLHELAGHYHCSIVGTCLSTNELRKLLTKLGLAAPADSEHDLHGRGVGLASRQDIAGKLLNKALDDRHQLTLKRYARAKTPEELQNLWREDTKSGDIPGGYWAVLTHPATTQELTREAFGYVHMLSHLVGAANRADIRRLQQLEDQNAALTDKLARQQAKLRDLALARDAAEQQWQRGLAAHDAAEPAPEAAENLHAVIADLRRKLDNAASRRQLAETHLARAQAEAAEARTAAARAEARANTLQAELDAVERSLTPHLDETSVAPLPPKNLGGITILYVGGRPTQLPHLRQAAATRGAALLHHDGGIEDNDLKLAGLVHRADLVLFPVDCVSHAAVGTVKRTCRTAGKTFLPLRSAAVTSFIAALGA